MIWDTVARIVEKLMGKHRRGEVEIHKPQKMFEVMQQTKLFVINAAPQDFLPKAFTVEQCEFYKENFFLPFRMIAIEDKASLVFLYDVEKHQRGLDCPRRWVEFLPGDAKIENFRERDDPKFQEAIKAKKRLGLGRSMLVTSGEIRKVVPRPGGEKTYIEGKVLDIFLQDMDTAEIIYDKTQLGTYLPAEAAQHMTNDGLRNALQAVEEVMYFNDPSNFVLEETPRSYERRRKNKGAKKRIQRSHDRPKYTVLKPRQIRRRLRLAEPSAPGGVKRRPHERRAHMRTYPDDAKKWPNVHGRTVVVKGSWIGPSTAEFGNKQYRVLVDMKPPQMEATNAQV